MKNFLRNLIWIIVLLMLVYIFQDKIQLATQELKNQYLPCKSEIMYSMGSFDSDFGISKEEFIVVVKEAEAIWEKTSGKDLFSYSEEESPSNLAINLIYDSRQETTDKLKQIDVKLGNTRSSYNALKANYEKLKIEYNQDKTEFDSRVSNFEIRKNKYEKDVVDVNASGGASGAEYARLEQEQTTINKEAKAINQLQTNLNNKADQVNGIAKELNQIATSLNLDVKKFNEIGASNGEEFEEGIYIRDMDGTRINIYQFDNKAKLVRVLAHELGHALGLEHVEDPQAIMYRLNSSTNKELTKDDLSELNKKCGSK